MPKYYVYLLRALPANRVFYVGKGSNGRMTYHRMVIERPHLRANERPFYKRFRLLLGDHSSFTEEKVFESDDEIETLLKERSLIEYYGFENLINTQTHAFVGRKLKPEVGKLISARLRAYVERCRQKYGSGHPPEVRAKMSAASRGKKKSPESSIKRWKKLRENQAHMQFLRLHMRQLADANRGVKQSAEHIERAHAPLRGKKQSTESIRSRIATRALNGKRSSKYRSTYRGVTWFEPKNAWQSRSCWDHKTSSLGQFKLEIDAAKVYDDAFEARFGSRPNGTRREHKISRFKVGLHGKLVLKN